MNGVNLPSIEVSVHRSLEMLLMNEELARQRMREIEQEAQDARRAARYRAVQKWDRRARRASRRAAAARALLD